MNTAIPSGSEPIYDSVLGEHGDAASEARRAAEHVEREAARLLRRKGQDTVTADS